MATPGKRAFWMHQGAEYLIGGAFVASGLQSPEPVVPTLMGGLVMINTACSKGPLSAFRIFGRRMHRLLDALLVLVVIAAAVQPVVAIDNGTRGIMVLLAVCLAVIWWQSDFSEPAPKPARTPRTFLARTVTSATAKSATTSPDLDRDTAPGPARAPGSRRASVPDGSTADTIGRTAGRLAGKGVKIYRERKSRAASDNNR